MALVSFVPSDSLLPPPMPSPELLPTPLPSPPFHRRPATAAGPFSSARKQRVPLQPIHSAHLLVSPLLQPTHPKSRPSIISPIEDLSNCSFVGLGLDDGDAFGVRSRPVVPEKKETARRSSPRSRASPPPPPISPRSPGTPRGHRRSRSISLSPRVRPRSRPRSPPLTPTMSSPPPPVPPIPSALLQPGDVIAKPVLRPLQSTKGGEIYVDQVIIPELTLDASGVPVRSPKPQPASREPMTCLRFFTLRNASRHPSSR